MKIRELLDLVESSAPEPEKRVEKIFDWRHARLVETAKWALGLGATLAVALAISTVKNEFQVVSIALVAFALVSGIVALLRGERVQREYAAALGLLARLATFRELIRRYRRM